jgi:Ca2+-transporting ATPase
LIVSSIGAIQSYRQELQFIELDVLKSERLVSVMRDGEEMAISVHDLVVGDVLILRNGEILPTDGIFLSGSGVRCNESAATGEEVLVAKGPESLFFIGSSKVATGSGRMLVLTTGPDTTLAMIRKTLEDLEAPPTDLHNKLEVLATRIGYVGLVAGVVIFLSLTIAYLIKFYPLYNGAFRAILNYFIMGLTVIVVAVPEGLPLSLVLTLVVAMRTLLHDRVLVKELGTMEALGETTAIVGHKSGLLTHNVMHVTRGWFYGTITEDVPDLIKTVGGVRRDLLARAIALNTDAGLKYTTDAFKAFRESRSGVAAANMAVTGGAKAKDATELAATEILEGCTLIGNRTEVALIHMLRLNLDIDYAYVRRTAGAYVYREGFTPQRRKTSTVYAPASPGSSTAPLATVTEGGTAAAGPAMGFPGSGKYTVYVTGAPEAVVGSCAVYMSGDGALVPMDPRRRETIAGMVDLLASRGLRPIALAVKAIDPANAPAGHDGDHAQRAWAAAVAQGSVESGLTLLGILGLRDPLRPGIADAVVRCRAGGIKVRLATGEHPGCAKALAESAGILTDGIIIDGATWRAMTPDDRSAILPRLEVLARATPDDKLSLVKALKEVGEVVLATGPDAAVLSAAHVGIAMGEWSTEMSKDAAKIIVLDATFTTLVKTVEWGRSIVENVRRFVGFQLTINGVAVALTFSMAIIHMGADIPFPLESIHLLWVNLIMDSLGALMLATEQPDPELLDMRPNTKAQPLVTKTMLKTVLVSASVQFALLMALVNTAGGPTVFGLSAATLGTRQHMTAIFNTFIFLQIFNFFNARRIHDQVDVTRGLRRAGFGLALLGAIAVLQIIWVEVGGDVLCTKMLDAAPLLISIALGAGSLLIGLAARFVPFRDDVFPKAGKASGKVLPAGATPYKPWLSRDAERRVARTIAATSRTSTFGGGDQTLATSVSTARTIAPASTMRSARVAPYSETEGLMSARGDAEQP